MVKFEYTLRTPQGLHARPAGALVDYVSKLPCEVTLHCGTRHASAKSIFSLMGMAIACGERISVELSGEDEAKSAQALKAFLEAYL